MVDIVGLKGDRVRLLPLERGRHLDNAYRWLNDPFVTAHTFHANGATLTQEHAYFDRIEATRENEFVWGIHDENGRHIGLIGLHEIQWIHRRAVGGILLGEQDAWGRGYASDAIRVRTQFAFHHLGLHRISGHTFNPAMRRVYEKCGYRHEGTLRAFFWRNGQWNDVDCYGLLASDRNSPSL